MALDDVGYHPKTQAGAIHRQLALTAGPVPVEAIAAALDMVEIRVADFTSFEGGLITTPERDIGSILVNGSSSRQRRRFTIGHELGHFLNARHEPTSPSGRFECSTADMASSWLQPSPEASQHARQENEANRFAIALLAPVSLMRRHMGQIPDLAHVLAAARALDLSREACARRYVQVAETAVAVVFTQGSVIRYIERHPDFPYISRRYGEHVIDLPPATDPSGLSDHEDADPGDWLAKPLAGGLTVQTLHQQNGYAMTLLALDEAVDDDDG